MKRIVSILLTALLLITALSLSVSAAGSCATVATDLEDTNLNPVNVQVRTARSRSFLEQLDDGRLMTLNYVVSEGRIEISYYTDDLVLLETFSIRPELPIWGGFYATDDHYYIITGQENPDELADVEVIRLTRYSKDWERLDSVGVFDANVSLPFASGNLRCVTADNLLLVHTSRYAYADKNGVCHQTNFTFSVDVNTMKVIDYRTVMNANAGHVSHSFDQYAYYDGQRFVTVDHGDAYPRAVVLYEYSPDSFKVQGKISAVNSAQFYRMGGVVGENDTGITTGGFAVSPTSYILVGHSRWDMEYNSGQLFPNYNAFVSVIDRTTYKTTLYPLSNYAALTAETPHLVKISDSSFLVLWYCNGEVRYQQLDGNGKPTGTVYTLKGQLSYNTPQVIDGKVMWYTHEEDVIDWYTISTTDLSDASVRQINNGHTDGYTGDGQYHWVECIDCGFTTEKLPHSEETFPNFSKKGTYDICCRTCFHGITSEPVTVKLTEDTSDTGGQVIRILLKTDTKTLKPTTDYTAERVEHRAMIIDGKSYWIELTYEFTSTGFRKGSFKKTFYRLPNTADIEPIAAQTYTGAALTPDIKATANGNTLKQGVDYTLSYADNTDVGTATVTINGIGSYYGSTTRTFRIGTSLADATVSGITDKTYTGKALTQSPTVVLDGKTLKEDTDYTVSHSDNTDVGTATVTITGKGRYVGTVKKTFEVTARSLSKSTVLLSKTDYAYNGEAHKPSVTVSDTGTILKEGTDYTVSYADNVKAGTATVTVTGKGNYTGTVKKTFTIAPPFTEATVTGLVSKSYTGTALTQSPTVVLDGKTLRSGTDYTVSYSNNIKVGTATVIISGKGSYSGTIKETFKITAQSAAKCKVTLSVSFYSYDGKTKTPSVTVKDAAGKTLKKNTDYTVTYAAGRKNAGSYKVTVKMKGNYTGSTSKIFKIAAQSVSKCKLSLSTTAYTYNGKTKTPSVTVKNAAGKTLKKNTDYTVTYAAGRKNAGSYKVTVKMKGNYTGSKTLTFVINPPKTSIKSLTAAKRSLKVTVTKSSQASGYQLQYSTSKTFKTALSKLMNGKSSTSVILNFLSAKKTYYVRVRTFKTVGIKKYYSGWSTVKYKKTK